MNAAALQIRGLISTMPKEQQDKIFEAYTAILAIADKGDDGLIALALVGTEKQE